MKRDGARETKKERVWEGKKERGRTEGVRKASRQAGLF